MYGNSYEEKFKQARALYMYMYAHPGKNLISWEMKLHNLESGMKREQDWGILEYPMHNKFHRFMRDLNLVYINHPALFKDDYKHEGFNWIDCHQEEKCVYTFERMGKMKILLQYLIFLMNIMKDMKFQWNIILWKFLWIVA